MELTRDEILILIDHYTNLKFDIENRMNEFGRDCINLLDDDLFNTQRKRYKNMLDGYKIRIGELQTELDIL